MNKNHKYRPLPILLVNAVGALAMSTFGAKKKLKVDRLLSQARRRTGLEDFGPDDFLEPFNLLVQCYNTEAKLNFIGRLSAKIYLLQLLENRLRLEHDRKEYPEIAKQKIQSPVFILGLPRTGSTLLFELMALNPALRAPMSWEVMLPSPPPQRSTFTCDPRIKKADRLFAWVDRIAPDFRHIHAIGSCRPQECLAISAQSFRSIQFHTTHQVPTYQAWLNDADLLPAYQYHRRMLQHFQAFGPQGTWLLKAPAHIFGIKELFDVYPDARIVQTHRDPIPVAGSIASHCVSLRQAFSETLDLDNIGTSWCRLWSMGLQRTLNFRRDHPEFETRFVDLPYEQLTHDPLDAVEKIHERFELSFEQEACKRVEEYLSANPKGRHGVHHYRLEDYGLSSGQVAKHFGSYRNQLHGEYTGPLSSFVSDCSVKPAVNSRH
ncbi:sulfotransferase [Planctomycetota bacterium]